MALRHGFGRKYMPLFCHSLPLIVLRDAAAGHPASVMGDRSIIYRPSASWTEETELPSLSDAVWSVNPSNSIAPYYYEGSL
jgi:hypothetical protein